MHSDRQPDDVRAYIRAGVSPDPFFIFFVSFMSNSIRHKYGSRQTRSETPTTTLPIR